MINVFPTVVPEETILVRVREDVALNGMAANNTSHCVTITCTIQSHSIHEWRFYASPRFKGDCSVVPGSSPSFQPTKKVGGP